MDGRFDEEVYKSEWQRVLPLGPHGIAPYVRTSRRWPARSDLCGPIVGPGALTQAASALGRVVARHGRAAIRWGGYAEAGRAARHALTAAGTPPAVR